MRDRLRIFEVDHPATQEWKRRCLIEAGIPVPASLTFVPVDFERERLPEKLTDAGFDSGRRAFFLWLGVVPYLTVDAVFSTLAFIAGLPGGADVAFDYSNPPESLTLDDRVRHEARAASVSGAGERWLSYFDSDELHRRLRALGFSSIDDIGPREIRSRYLPGAPPAPSDTGGHVVLASTHGVI